MLNGVRAAVGRTARPRAMRHCPSLRRHCIESVNRPYALLQIACQLRRLRTLRIAHVDGLSDQVMQRLALRCARLQARAAPCCAARRTCSPDAGRPRERQRFPSRRCWMRHTPRLETRRSVRLCDTARSCVSSAWSNVSRCAAVQPPVGRPDVCVGQTLCFRVARASSPAGISAAVASARVVRSVTARCSRSRCTGKH